MNPPDWRTPSRTQRLLDHLLFPINMWLGEQGSLRLGLTPIDHERILMALRHCSGTLLDVACGNNLLVRSYGRGFGIDIHPYADIDVRARSDALPVRSASFDSVALLACLNHLHERAETLRECHRVLRPRGRLILSMIPPWVGFFSHPIRRRHDPDQLERGMAHDEDWGLSTRAVRELLEEAGFALLIHEKFLWRLNNLYVGERTA